VGDAHGGDVAVHGDPFVVFGVFGGHGVAPKKVGYWFKGHRRTGLAGLLVASPSGGSREAAQGAHHHPLK
jgi:hypothetical protein